MKIGKEIFYKLYYGSLDLKIEEAEEDLKLFKKSFETIKAIIKTYKPYIETQISTPYIMLLAAPPKNIVGKLSERYVFEDKLYTKEAFLTYFNSYRNTYLRIKKKKELVAELNKRRVAYKIYSKIIKKFNLKIAKEIVYRQYTFNLGYGLGKIGAVRKITTKDNVNWNASNKRRDKLIAKGLTPYYKEDEERAIANGEEYNGVNWLILHNKDSVWIHHFPVGFFNYKFQLIKSNLNKSLKYYLTEFKNKPNFNVKSFPLYKSKKI